MAHTEERQDLQGSDSLVGRQHFYIQTSFDPPLTSFVQSLWDPAVSWLNEQLDHLSFGSDDESQLTEAFGSAGTDPTRFRDRVIALNQRLRGDLQLEHHLHRPVHQPDVRCQPQLELPVLHLRSAAAAVGVSRHCAAPPVHGRLDAMDPDAHDPRARPLPLWSRLARNW